MKVTARPLTKREWDEMRPTGPGPYTKIHAIDQEDADRIEATINHGWAKEPPTPADLDTWAAESIMGWHRTSRLWLKHYAPSAPGKPAVWEGRGLPHIRADDWRPSQNLGQALECVAQTNYESSWHHSFDGAHRILVVLRVGDDHVAYRGPYDEAAIAEAIMRRLHAELAS